MMPRACCRSFAASVRESELLLNNLDQPLVVLASHVRQILDSEYLLKELVRAADVELGRVFGERPHFEKEGCPPHPDDRYTLESVRIALSELLEGLAAGDPSRCVNAKNSGSRGRQTVGIRPPLQSAHALASVATPDFKR